MSTPTSTPNSLDPEAGFTETPSVAQAANDLRAAAGEKARELIHTAEEKANALRERAVESAQHFRETATERANQMKATATEKAAQFRETANEQWDETRVKAKEFQVTAEDYIRQNPAQCVISALGVGFLIGLIVRR
ncbi:MAG: hypothetical protein WED15_04090 [Akkermansiaceae bacterium]